MYSDLFGNSKFNIAREMCTQIKNYSQWMYLEMSHNEWLQQEKKLREESSGTFFCSFQGRRSMGDRPRVQLKIVYDNRSKTELKQQIGQWAIQWIATLLYGSEWFTQRPCLGSMRLTRARHQNGAATFQLIKENRVPSSALSKVEQAIDERGRPSICVTILLISFR